MTSASKKIATHAGKSPRIPLTGLLDVALESMLAEFREELGQGEFKDIRPTHGCVFRFVKEDGMRLTDLAELASITKQSAGEIVDDLVARGYVQRIPDPADRRAKLICLTERGEEAQAHGFGLFAEVEKRWMERYGREQIEQLRAILEEIAATEAPEAVPELARPELASV
ncbi:MAG: MarR family winged helix-turn-helix transcriptional regulator [Solirubrobacterales bacterium]